MSKPAVKQTVKVALGEAGRPVGTLTYSKDGGLDILPRLKAEDSYCAHPGMEPE
jgi:hypothetical protein